MSDYNLKYIKYKTKYLELKGGGLFNYSTKRSDLTAVKVNGLALEHLSEKSKADRKIVLAAVTQDGFALQFASDKLKADRNIVLAAVTQDGFALQFAHTSLMKDKDLVFAYYKLYFITNVKNSDIRENFKDEVKYDTLYADKEIMLAMVKEDGLLLDYAYDELKSDREVVLAAVKQNGVALEYASDELISDKEVVLAAVKQHGLAYSYASDELKIDTSIIAAYKAYLITNAKLSYVRKAFIIDLTNIDQNNTFNNKLNTDKEFMLVMVKQDGALLRYASKILRADKDIVLAAVTEYGLAYKYASDELKADASIIAVYKAYLITNTKLSYVRQAFINNTNTLETDKELVLAMVTQDGLLLKYASDTLKADKEVVLAAIKQNKSALRFASDTLKTNKNSVLMAK